MSESGATPLGDIETARNGHTLAATSGEVPFHLPGCPGCAALSRIERVVEKWNQLQETGVGRLMNDDRKKIREQEVKPLQRVVGAARTVDPDKLDLLADWFDQDDANKGKTSSPEVQADLRRWARALRETLGALDG